MHNLFFVTRGRTQDGSLCRNICILFYISTLVKNVHMMSFPGFHHVIKDAEPGRDTTDTSDSRPAHWSGRAPDLTSCSALAPDLTPCSGLAPDLGPESRPVFAFDAGPATTSSCFFLPELLEVNILAHIKYSCSLLLEQGREQVSGDGAMQRGGGTL